MRSTLLLSLPVAAACSLFAKSPALQDPLHDRLAKADLPGIEDATKACLTREGWTPARVGSYAEGATVVNARNAAKDEISIYIHSAEVSPRVTGGPSYDDPFWGCLGKSLEGGQGAPSPEGSSSPSAAK